jgi:hypothetical protein
MTDLNTFLTTVFDGCETDETVLLARQTSVEGGFNHTPWPSKAADRLMRSKKKAATYFTVSTVREPDMNEDGETRTWRRRKADCVAAYVIVLDDIGTKVGEIPPVEPSYKLESSKGNFQWGYLIQPTENLSRYEAIVEALGELGFTDKGAGGYNRVMRVPGSINLKPGRKNFESSITDWQPNRIFELDTLAIDLGVDLDNLEVRRSSGVTVAAGGAALAGGVIDPLLIWLGDNGHVVEDNDADWVSLTCPWSEKHTTGASTAGYSPLGRGGSQWAETRAFKCLHEHCLNHKFSDFRDWAFNQGGPLVMGYDPLPWIQNRYVYVGVGKRVADLENRPSGSDWLFDLEEWSLFNYRRIPLPDHDRPVLLKNAFLESDNTIKAINTSYYPGGGAIIDRDDKRYVNTYIEPQHPVTQDRPDVFLDHIDFLLGDNKERDLFLDWLAWKIQNPGKRSYAIVMVADGIYGTGRSWLREMLERALQGKVKSATLAMLVGKGAATETYNDWAAECQFLVVEEAKDNLSRDDFYQGYETLKQRVDNRVVSFICNPKYGKTRQDRMYFNALIFSNHSDAMVIPENDRRLCVLSNPNKLKDREYYERLNTALHDGEAGRVYWYLKRRDVGKFDHVYPLMTAQKESMIEQSMSAYDEILQSVLDRLEGDIVTFKTLQLEVKGSARDLGMEKVDNAPGAISRRIWKKLGKLRPDKNGARYMLDGDGRIEVRALRNFDLWKVVDDARDRDEIFKELEKNTGSVLAFPKIA